MISLVTDLFSIILICQCHQGCLVIDIGRGNKYCNYLHQMNKTQNSVKPQIYYLSLVFIFLHVASFHDYGMLKK